MQPIIAVALMLQQHRNARPLTRIILIIAIACPNLGLICETSKAETETTIHAVFRLLASTLRFSARRPTSATTQTSSECEVAIGPINHK